MSSTFNVLIADDKKQDRTRIVNALAQVTLQYQVDEATDGDSFIKKLSGNDYHLIICNVSLPGLEEYQSLERALQQKSSLPVVAVSNRFSEQQARHVLGMGAIDYIPKTQEHFFRLPYVIDSLYKQLELREARDQYKKSLRHSQERYNSLYALFCLMADNVPDMMWAKDKDKNYIFANQAHCDQILCTKDSREPIGKNDRFFAARQAKSHPSQPDWYTLHKSFERTDDEVMQAAESRRFEETGFVCGKRIVLDVIKAPLLDEQNNVIGTVGSARNITHARAMQAALKTTEEKYRSFIDSTREGVIMLGSDNRTEYVNQRMVGLLGRPAEELQGTYFADLLKDTEGSRAGTFLEDLAKGSTERHEFCFRHKDGQYIWTTVAATPFLSEDQQYKGAMALVTDITLRKNAEDRLRKSESRFRQIWENSFDGMRLIDSDGRIQLVNKAYCRIINRNEADLLGQPFYTVYAKEAQPDMIKNFTDNFFKGTIVSYLEQRFVLYDGREVWFELSNSYVYKNDRPDLLLSIFRDVTDRKKAELSILEKEERYRTIFDLSPSGILLEDSRGTIMEANPAFCNSLGYERSELVGQHVSLLTHPSNIDSINSNIKRLLDGEILKHVEKSVRRDKSTCYMELNEKSVMLPNGQMGIMCIANDISDRLQAEQKLKEQITLNENVINTAPVIILILDKNGCIREFNDYACRLTGYQSAEVIGKKWFDLFIEKADRKPIKQVFREIFKGNEQYRGTENNIVTKDGHKKLIYWQNSRLKNDRGQYYAVLSVGIDISEQRALEEQFRQAQKMEAVGRLAGGVAHDFNNLLTAIKGYAELGLMKLNKNDPLFHTLTEIDRATERAETVTSQLLAFSRKQVLKPRFIDLNHIILDMSRLLKRLIGESIELATLLHANDSIIKADRGQLEQVIMNLVVNARDALNGQGKILIQTFNQELTSEKSCPHTTIKPGYYLVLKIQDQGSGISDEVLPHIFEPFFTTKGEGEGSGLGLSTVFGIISQSNGEICVKTDIKKGTTFEIFLPPQKQHVKMKDETELTDNNLRGSETILVVEDDQVVRQLALNVLHMYGYNVLEAPQAGDALLICEQREKPVDMVLCDIKLPRMNGTLLVERLAKIHPEMKVMYMSGYIGELSRDIERIERQDINFIKKPFKPIELIQRIRHILDKANS